MLQINMYKLEIRNAWFTAVPIWKFYDMNIFDHFQVGILRVTFSSVHWSHIRYLTSVTAPAHPHTADAIVYTAFILSRSHAVGWLARLSVCLSVCLSDCLCITVPAQQHAGWMDGQSDTNLRKISINWLICRLEVENFSHAGFANLGPLIKRKKDVWYLLCGNTLYCTMGS